MTTFAVDDKIEAVTLIGKDSVSLKLQYSSNKAPLGRGSALIESLHSCLGKLIESQDGMTLAGIQSTMSPYPIKLNCDDPREAELALISMVKKAFAAQLEPDKLLQSRKALPPAAPVVRNKLNAEKMERAFDAALEMGDALGSLHPARLATFFYEMSEAQIGTDLREEARLFLLENKYMQGDHEALNQRINKMILVAQQFNKNESKQQAIS